MVLVENTGARTEVPESELDHYLTLGYKKVVAEELENEYENLSYSELGDLIEERGLESKRSKEDRIQVLIDADTE